MTEIDLYRINKKIKERFWKRYGVDPRLTKCLRQVWGWPDCNDVGVFSHAEETRIELKGQKMWNAEIEIAVAPNGWHAFSTNYQYNEGGGGYAPSVSAIRAFTTRDEAMGAALEELIERYSQLRDRADRGYTITETQQKNAAKMVELLEFMLNPTPSRPDTKPAESAQLSLF